MATESRTGLSVKEWINVVCLKIMALEMRFRNCYVKKNSGTRGAEICTLKTFKRLDLGLILYWFWLLRFTTLLETGETDLKIFVLIRMRAMQMKTLKVCIVFTRVKSFVNCKLIVTLKKEQLTVFTQKVQAESLEKELRSIWG